MYHINRYGDRARCLCVRPTMPELDELMARARELFRDVAVWREQKKRLMFNGGGEMAFRHLEREEDARKYQGHGYTWILIEEAGNYPTPGIPDLLWGALRSAYGVTCRYILNANPGGPGHNWVKHRYIDPAPPFTPFDAELSVSGKSVKTRRIFIPSRLEDNRILVENDPNYEINLMRATAGKPWLYRAWRLGDWNITAGGMFDAVWDNDIHALTPFKIPVSWPIYRAFDWGSTKPFSIGWWAISNGEMATMSDGTPRFFPPGTFIRVDEWYGWTGEPNRGVGMPDSEIAKEIVRREEKFGRKIRSGPADSSIFVATNRRSIADEYRPYGIYWKPADKRPGSRVMGWRKLHGLLLAAVKGDRERPALYAFDTCRQFIRTVPALPRDKRNPDDVDTSSEDHVGDETRYMITYRPSVAENTNLPGF